ncbi:GNAT family N-acetyltransferase [Saccharibacillus sp. O23]|uniref:GNAT family N-acetyltransferase n=1 Tax=Saccharibacillus sp. O23 TaxID=2009338 RepID=UPI000B4E5B8D|nr:GNAT family N-acetyltransferase [Saccharibacillus sp. O23]OWR28496.1 GNAT family N-acetyltransferase [Saccharibacillus sp. O23]
MHSESASSVTIVPAAPEQFPRLARLWLDASLSAHDFIDAAYWIDNKQAMEQQYLPASEVYVCMENGEVAGFVAMVDQYLAALFVDPAKQGRGYGRMLLEHVKNERETIMLNVFAQNAGACAFYRRNGFEIEKEQIDEATGAREQVMVWRQ